jgi:hypothetical protein
MKIKESGGYKGFLTRFSGQAIRYGIGVGRDGFTWSACSR